MEYQRRAIKNELGIWSVLKSCVGKDLSKIAMPVQFNEPLSFLQRIAELLEYISLVNSASQSESKLDRIQLISAFAISNLSSNTDRLGKPFNPLFGETYELERDGYRLACEQVSHHPPISAFHAESEKFIFQGWIHPKLKLGAKSVEIHPKGVMKLLLKRFDENYTWGNVNCSVHNVIVGKLWIEHHGQMEICSLETGLKASLHFKPAGWFHNELHKVEGFILDITTKKKQGFLYGKWTESLIYVDIDSYEDHEKDNSNSKKSSSVSPKPGKKIFQKFNSLSIRTFSTSTEPTDEFLLDDDGLPKNGTTEIIEIPNSKIIWEAIAKPEYSSEYYYFTLFAMSLNELDPSKSLPPTDSRFRADIRRLEKGFLEAAGEEKSKLEEQQRKLLKNSPELYFPKWFTKSGDFWDFNGEYWNKKTQ